MTFASIEHSFGHRKALCFSKGWTKLVQTAYFFNVSVEALEFHSLLFLLTWVVFSLSS